MDIDDLKNKERLIRAEHEHAEAIIRTVPNPLILLSHDLRIRSTNRAFNRAFKISPALIKGALFSKSTAARGIFPACAPC